jgi:hypothetical protein
MHKRQVVTLISAKSMIRRRHLSLLRFVHIHTITNFQLLNKVCLTYASFLFYNPDFESVLKSSISTRKIKWLKTHHFIRVIETQYISDFSHEHTTDCIDHRCQ